MLGLIEKDLRLTLSRTQTLLLFFIMTLVMGITIGGSFLISYPAIIAMITAVGTISYDEFDNSFAFLMTLPFDRKTYVREKYLFSFLMISAGSGLGAVLYCIGAVFRHNAVPLTDTLPMLMIPFPVFYLFAAILIPLQLKYGSEKSRIVFSVLFGSIAILLFGVKSVFSGSNHPFLRIAKRLDGLSPIAVLLPLTAVSVLLTCAFYLWSIRILEKKEF